MSKASDQLDAPYTITLNESELRVLRYALASVDLKTGEQRPINWGNAKNRKALLEAYANICSKVMVPSLGKPR